MPPNTSIGDTIFIEQLLSNVTASRLIALIVGAFLLLSLLSPEKPTIPGVPVHDSSPGQMNKHLAGQTSPDNLSFGYGKLACPGRHFAVNEVKLMIARLINEYDLDFPDNITCRPKTMYADEFVFTDPNAKIMKRLRHRE